MIVEVSPADWEIVRTMEVGSAPSFVAAPDGSRLYVASSGHWDEEAETLKENLSVIEPTSGQTLDEVTIEGRLTSHIPTSRTLTISSEGRWLYFLQFIQRVGPEYQTYRLATFDTVGGQVLPETVPLGGGCGRGIPPLISAPESRSVYVFCPESQVLHFIGVSETGAASATETLTLPVVPDSRQDAFGNPRELGRVAGVVLSPDGTTIYATTGNGRVFVVDVASRKIQQEADLKLPAGAVIPADSQVELSPDGQTLYLGLQTPSQAEHARDANQVLEVNTESWDVGRLIPTSGTFDGLTLDPSGTYLYAPDMEQKVITIVNVMQGRESRILRDVADAPEIVVTVPKDPG